MRLLIYDRTCVRTGGGLTAPWTAGSWLYRRLGRLDRARGVASWDEALAWLAAQPGPIAEIQYWGHGRWGNALIAGQPLGEASLVAGGPHHGALRAVRARLAPGALLWLRACEAFGARAGIAWAEALSDFFGAHVAGHTHVIGYHQSGLRGLRPGARADWDPTEGLAEGERRRAGPSARLAPVGAADGDLPDRRGAAVVVRRGGARTVGAAALSRAGVDVQGRRLVRRSAGTSVTGLGDRATGSRSVLPQARQARLRMTSCSQ